MALLRMSLARLRGSVTCRQHRSFCITPLRRMSGQVNFDELQQQVRQAEQTHGNSNAKLLNPYNALSDAYLSQNDLSNAIRYLEKALRIAEEEPSEALAVLYANLARLYRSTGDSEKALEIAEKGLAAELQTTDDTDLKIGLWFIHIAQLYTDLKRHTEAQNWLAKALSIAEGTQHEHMPTSATFYKTLGDVYLSSQQLKESLEAYHHALRFIENKEAFKIKCKIGQIYEELGDLSNAESSYQEVIKDPDLDKFDRALVQYKLGLFNDNRGKLNAAIYFHQAARTTAKSIAEPSKEQLAQQLTAAVNKNFGIILLVYGQHQEAADALQEAKATLEAQGESVELADVLGLLGIDLNYTGDSERAAEALKAAADICATINEPLREAFFLGYLGDSYCENEQYDDAFATLRRAVELWQIHGDEELHFPQSFKQDLFERTDFNGRSKAAFDRLIGNRRTYLGWLHIAFAQSCASLLQISEAVASLEKAIAVYSEIEGPDSETVQSLKESLIEFKRE